MYPIEGARDGAARAVGRGPLLVRDVRHGLLRAYRAAAGPRPPRDLAGPARRRVRAQLRCF